ncbi:uncharacterized protein LOC118644964 isoform X2 [Monomorium pharaonis]|uniref:uncharacterized protein LOC118644964 isoform X2 n=1 Tax=Monomorium pharaonis TaxID=307658 RepID=UPI001746BFF5|nr:uncharacterized protein LOC118644964 isoform X2 [Monomorium pharaonis]
MTMSERRDEDYSKTPQATGWRRYCLALGENVSSNTLTGQVYERRIVKAQNNNDAANSMSNDTGSHCSPEKTVLRVVLQHLRQSSTNCSEEMLLNQMLSGPEVNLGIE